jgi:hypothetical protein
VDQKLDTINLATPHLRRETRTERAVNLAFTGLLLVTVIGLWIYFR